MTTPFPLIEFLIPFSETSIMKFNNSHPHPPPALPSVLCKTNQASLTRGHYLTAIPSTRPIPKEDSLVLIYHSEISTAPSGRNNTDTHNVKISSATDSHACKTCTHTKSWQPKNRLRQDQPLPLAPRMPPILLHTEDSQHWLCHIFATTADYTEVGTSRLYTRVNKNPSAWNFLSPKPVVTCGTVAIIIWVILLSPYLRIHAVSLSSIHYNQSHRVYINRRWQYICLILKLKN